MIFISLFQILSLRHSHWNSLSSDRPIYCHSTHDIVLLWHCSGPASQTLFQHQTNTGTMSGAHCFCCLDSIQQQRKRCIIYVNVFHVVWVKSSPWICICDFVANTPFHIRGTYYCCIIMSIRTPTIVTVVSTVHSDVTVAAADDIFWIRLFLRTMRSWLLLIRLLHPTHC